MVGLTKPQNVSVRDHGSRTSASSTSSPSRCGSAFLRGAGLPTASLRYRRFRRRRRRIGTLALAREIRRPVTFRESNARARHEVDATVRIRAAHVEPEDVTPEANGAPFVSRSQRSTHRGVIRAWDARGSKWIRDPRAWASSRTHTAARHRIGRRRASRTDHWHAVRPDDLSPAYEAVRARDGRERRFGSRHTISSRARPRPLVRAERKIDYFNGERQVGSALPADGMRPATHQGA